MAASSGLSWENFPRQTRRSSHVCLQKLVSLEQISVLFQREPSKFRNIYSVFIITIYVITQYALQGHTQVLL